MVRIDWTDNAVRQLESSCKYIAQDSPDQAKRIYGFIQTAIDRLETFPESGTVVPKWKSQFIREIRVFRYRIFYQWLQEENQILILAVVHGARRLAKKLLG